MLAVLPNAPALIHPGRNRELLRSKRNRLLDSLHEAGAFDALTLALAKQEPLPPAPRPLPMLAPHLLARIRAEQGRRGPRYRTGDQSPWLRTTLQKRLQQRVARLLERHRGRLASNGVHNAAALVLEVETGRVAAYVGNAADLGSAEHGAFVDIVPAPRSTGSVLKPLLYAALLQAGEVLPGQLVPDVPTHLGAFHPENFDRAYAGAVPAQTALARSLNVPAVRMLRSFSVDRFCALLRRLGMTTLFRPARHYGLSLILGGAEGSLWEITGIYAGLARSVNRYGEGVSDRGVFHPPEYVWRERPRPGDGAVPPLGAGAAYLTLQAMLEVERPGEERAWRAFSSSRKVAWKTGTSYGFRDAWAVGVTPRHAVGVWVGNADGEGRPGLTGYSAAAPILFEIHDLLPAGRWFEVPEAELHEVDVCAHSGHRLGPHCRERRSQLVTRAGLGAAPCSYCRLLHTDADDRWQVHAACEPVASIKTQPWFVLPATMEWHYRRVHAGYRPPPPFRPDCRSALGETPTAALSCVYPKQGAQVYVPLEIDGSLGRVVLEAAHRDPRARVFWHLDDRYQGETTDVHQMELAPPPGRHTLTLVDDRGETIRRRFTVLGRLVGVLDQSDREEEGLTQRNPT
jgi:penicillin-binding protein 1C